MNHYCCHGFYLPTITASALALPQKRICSVISDKVSLQTLTRGNSLACIFLDVSKAFDSLPHHLIIVSLAKGGICRSWRRTPLAYLVMWLLSLSSLSNIWASTSLLISPGPFTLTRPAIEPNNCWALYLGNSIY